MGGPVTVTHREVDRYFMMLEEAAALVLQSAALGAKRCEDSADGHDESGCIYVLEMGEPVNIGRLARHQISYSRAGYAQSCWRPQSDRPTRARQGLKANVETYRGA